MTAVSASIGFSVSSNTTVAYLNRIFASWRGDSLLLCKHASRHARPVEISFWYSSIRVAFSDIATSCTEPRALSKHSSATATIRWTVSRGLLFGVLAGDFLVILGE